LNDRENRLNPPLLKKGGLLEMLYKSAIYFMLPVISLLLLDADSERHLPDRNSSDHLLGCDVNH